MNDRAPTARKASRYIRGVGADGQNDFTCAHHAITNIFEEARKAMDGVLKAMMNITEEQAKSDAAKIKKYADARGLVLVARLRFDLPSDQFLPPAILYVYVIRY